MSQLCATLCSEMKPLNSAVALLRREDVSALRMFQGLQEQHSEAQQPVRSLPAFPVPRPPLRLVHRLGRLLPVKDPGAAAQDVLPHGGDGVRQCHSEYHA